MEESQVEAVYELRWTMTSANFQGVETSPAILFKPTNCSDYKCSLSPPLCVGKEDCWEKKRKMQISFYGKSWEYEK